MSLNAELQRLYIAGTASSSYVRAMAAIFVRLMTLVALVLMPIGMANASAAAGPVERPAATALGHCEDKKSEDKAPESEAMACAAACAALAASPRPALAAPLKLKAQQTMAIEPSFNGIVLEIATPPPRVG